MGEDKNYPFDSKGLSQEARVILWLVVGIAIMLAVVLVGRWDSPLQAAVRPAAELEQCANLGTTCDSTHAAQWQNGNLGSSNSAFAEGDSVPYRATFSNLTVGQTYKVDVEWDATQSSHHALDYITSFDRTVTTASPCSGIACGAPTSTLPIPLDSRVSGAGVTQVAGQSFSAFGATFPSGGSSVPNTGNLCGTATCSITANPSTYSYSGTYAGTSQTQVSVYFTANNEEVVLAWGGHIASRADWGTGNSAAVISGSPYHMRLIDFACSDVENCSSGNKDRSLSSAAVTLPSSITIVKQASAEGSTEFPFVGSPSPLTSFTLTDDGTAANTRVFSGITAFGTYTVTESVPATWGLDRVACSITNQTTGSTSVVGNVATIVLGEGEDVICTFYNSPLPAPALALTKTADVENYSGAGQLITYTYVIRNSGNVAIGPVQFTVDDDKINGGEPFNCGPAATTLAVNDTVTCTAVYTTLTGDVDLSVTNTAFAAAGQVVSPTRQVTVPFVSTTTTIPLVPALALTKTADVENFSGAGQLITYTYVIRNSGNVAIGPVQFTVDDDKINGGEPFSCGPAATTLAVNETVTCTAVYTTVTGDIETSVVNTAFAAAGQVVSPNQQVTVPYVATTTTTTLAPTTTTTLAPTTTTTLAPTTTTTLAPVTTTTVPVELQVVTPDNPTGTEDVLDVLFPAELPETGLRIGLVSVVGGLLLLLGLGTITVSSNRRSSQRAKGRK
jgi:hypothetical protein